MAATVDHRHQQPANGVTTTTSPELSGLSVDAINRMLGILEMRAYLIQAQYNTTRGQITVMKDKLACARMQASTAAAAAALRTSRQPSPPPTLTAVRRRSKRKFEERKIIAIRKNARRTAEDTCAVCLEPVGGADAVETVCSHAFHGLCIDQWVAEKFDKPSCPVCRAQLFVPT
jgi:hypothetical protein